MKKILFLFVLILFSSNALSGTSYWGVNDGIRTYYNNDPLDSCATSSVGGDATCVYLTTLQQHPSVDVVKYYSYKGWVDINGNNRVYYLHNHTGNDSVDPDPDDPDPVDPEVCDASGPTHITISGYEDIPSDPLGSGRYFQDGCYYDVQVTELNDKAYVNQCYTFQLTKTQDIADYNDVDYSSSICQVEPDPNNCEGKNLTFFYPNSPLSVFTDGTCDYEYVDTLQTNDYNGCSELSYVGIFGESTSTINHNDLPSCDIDDAAALQCDPPTIANSDYSGCYTPDPPQSDTNYTISPFDLGADQTALFRVTQCRFTTLNNVNNQTTETTEPYSIGETFTNQDDNACSFDNDKLYNLQELKELTYESYSNVSVRKLNFSIIHERHTYYKDCCASQNTVGYYMGNGPIPDEKYWYTDWQNAYLHRSGYINIDGHSFEFTSNINSHNSGVNEFKLNADGHKELRAVITSEPPQFRTDQSSATVLQHNMVTLAVVGAGFADSGDNVSCQEYDDEGVCIDDGNVNGDGESIDVTEIVTELETLNANFEQYSDDETQRSIDLNETLNSIDEKFNQQGQLPSHTTTDSGYTTFSQVNAGFVNGISNTALVLSLSNIANIVDYEETSCPALTIDLTESIGTVLSTTVHCDVFEEIAPILSNVLLIVYAFAGFRIFASS